MTRSRTRRPAAIYAVLQVVSVALALWLSKHFQVARLSATLVALAPTVPTAYLAWAAFRDDRREAAADTDAWAGFVPAAVVILYRVARRAWAVVQRGRALRRLPALSMGDRTVLLLGPRPGFWRTLQAWAGWRLPRAPHAPARTR
ncbi:hypothetical protein [Streptomyces sp. NPDC005732]|uniref:hypothetical protein n=1 Tax=Streptomyces sp. NPDC005732 TaxID=3157057 RepID=UPI003408CDE9